MAADGIAAASANGRCLDVGSLHGLVWENEYLPKPYSSPCTATRNKLKQDATSRTSHYLGEMGKAVIDDLTQWMLRGERG